MPFFRRKENKDTTQKPSPWKDKVDRMLLVKPRIDEMVGAMEREMGLMFRKLADFHNLSSGDHSILRRYREKYDIGVEEWSVYLIERRRDENLPASVKPREKRADAGIRRNTWEDGIQKMLLVKPRLDEMVKAIEKERGITYGRLADYDKLTQDDFDMLMEYRDRFGIAVDDWTIYVIERNADERYEGMFGRSRHTNPPVKTRVNDARAKMPESTRKAEPRQNDPVRKNPKRGKCRQCKGVGYRQIESTDRNALPGSYIYGVCPDCGGTGDG